MKVDFHTEEGTNNLFLLLLIFFIIFLIFAWLLRSPSTSTPSDSSIRSDIDPDCVAPEAGRSGCY